MTTKIVDYLPTLETEIVGVDIETTWQNKKRDTADPYTDRIISIQVSDGNDVWILQNNFTCLIPVLTNPNVKKICHNYYFDGQFLEHTIGTRTKNIYDSLIVERVINTGMTGVDNDLASTVARRLGVTLNKETRSQFANHTGPMTKEQLDYAAADVIHLLNLRESQIKDVSNQQLGRIVSLENEFVSVLVKATLEGVGFDHELWDQQQKQIYLKVRELESKLADLAGLGRTWDIFGESVIDANLGSTQQLQKLIKSIYGVEVHSTSEESLKELSHKGSKELTEFIDVLLEYKEWQKRSTWRFDEYVNPITGNIHANVNQLQARTGRMSMNSPNLQNVPSPLKLKEGEPNFRLIFLPKAMDYNSFSCSDFEKQEPGIVAHLSGDEVMITAYNSEDMYVEVAKSVYNKQEISKQERFACKTGLLASLYGAGIQTLARHMSISEQVATEFKNRVRRSFPKAARWSDAQEGLLKRRGFTLTAMGRRQNFPEIVNGGGRGSYYSASINYAVQGTAADMTKYAGVLADRVLEENNYDATIVLFVHDEILVRVRDDQAEEVKYQVLSAMELAASEICPSVQIRAEGHVNKRWTKG
jgi:DNA polymerase-1